MEDLNKQQFVLLTLLVSFVTSIATGVMTVSLLQRAPLEVTRTINQVVEKTIQQVMPENSTGLLSPKTTKEVTTVVVKEEDQIIAAINKNIKSIVRIQEQDGQGNIMAFYGIGLVITKDGQIVASRRTITAGNAYTATLSDGTVIELNPLGVDKKTNFIVFAPLKPNQIKVGFVPATLSDSEPKLGQSVISLGGDSQNAVAVGRTIFLSTKDTVTASSTTKTLTSIETDLASKDIVLGSPLFNLSGDIVGVQLFNESSKSFSPISVLKKELPILISTQKTL